MKDSKLISIYRSLKPQEFKRFGQFVHSPFFNRLNNVIKLYEILRKYYPSFSSKNLTDKEIYKKIFKGEEFNYWKFKNLTSDMMKLTEEFLAYHRYRSNNFDSKRYLLEELSKRKVDKVFEKNLNELEQMLENSQTRGEVYYFRKYNTELITGMHNSSDTATETNLQDITDNFINYSLLRILKLYIYMINEEDVYKSGNKKLILLSEIINHIEKYSYGDIPLIRIYFIILRLLLKSDDKYYFELKELKLKYQKLIEEEELEDVYTALRNYCTKKVLRGDKDFLKEYLELSNEILTQETDKEVQYFQFMNFIISALRLGEINEAEEFIENYKGKLSREDRMDTVNLTRGMVYFAKGEYEVSLGELKKINFDDCHHKMHLRNLMLQNYYELNYFEAALSMIDAYRHFLSRDKSITE